MDSLFFFFLIISNRPYLSQSLGQHSHSSIHFHFNKPKNAFPIPSSLRFLFLFVADWIIIRMPKSNPCKGSSPKWRHIRLPFHSKYWIILGFLHFRNVHLLTFDEGGRKACDHRGKAAIHLPGWIKLHSGLFFSINSSNSIQSKVQVK